MPTKPRVCAPLLKELDAIINPQEPDLTVWNWFYEQYAEDLASFTRDGLDKREREAFDDSTLKHQIFDYAPRRKRKAPKTNDIAYVLACWASGQKELIGQLRKDIANLIKQKASNNEATKK